MADAHSHPYYHSCLSFGRAGWNLDDVCVQTMTLHYGPGCRTFQTAPHINQIHMSGVWTPSIVVDGHMAAHSHRYHYRCFPIFGIGRADWNPRQCKCANHATYAIAQTVEPFKLHLTSLSYICKVFEHHQHQLMWMGIWLHTHTVTTTTYVSPDLGELAEILGDVSVQTMSLRYGWCCRSFQTASHNNSIHTSGVWASSNFLD